MTHPLWLLQKLRARTWALVVLVLVAIVTPGCQFLQNEFFYLCPTPQGPQQDPDAASG